MKGVYIVSAIFGLMWLTGWLNHRFWSRFPSESIPGDMIVKALSKSPRWAAVQREIDWPARWQMARDRKIVPIKKAQQKRIKAGRFSG